MLRRSERSLHRRNCLRTGRSRRSGGSMFAPAISSRCCRERQRAWRRASGPPSAAVLPQKTVRHVVFGNSVRRGPAFARTGDDGGVVWTLTRRGLLATRKLSRRSSSLGPSCVCMHLFVRETAASPVGAALAPELFRPRLLAASVARTSSEGVSATRRAATGGKHREAWTRSNEHRATGV
jgi:hypothetical protein